METLNSDTVRVGSLFSEGHFFSIPDYQRPFSWDRDQLSDLIEDVTSAEQDRDYFLGTLVLHQTDGHSYDVVDGQQRLTALSILLACIRDLLASDATEVQELLVQPEKTFHGIPSRVRLTVRDSGPFESIVANERGTLGDFSADPISTAAEERYHLAVSIFREVLNDLPQERLRALTEFIVRRVVFIVLSAGSFEEAFRLFTVVNDRGKQLRRVDVLKAKNLSPDAITHEHARHEYALKWETFEETLGEKEFEGLFHALRLIYVQEKPEGDLLHEFDEKVFKKANRPDLGKSFIDALGEYVDLYDALFVSRDYLQESSDHIRFKTLMFSMVREFRASEWRACMLAFCQKFKTVRLMDFLLKIEMVFVDHWVRGVRKDERYGSYTGILKSIEVNKTADAVIESIGVSRDAVQAACRRENFYGAGFAKYLLVRAEIQAAELTSPREFPPRSVEHVLPQTPGAESTWRSWFTGDEIKELLHTSGNLVLLSKGKNSSAQNKEFNDKKKSYLAPRVSEYPRSMEVLDYQEWLPETIRERTEAFAQDILSEP